MPICPKCGRKNLVKGFLPSGTPGQHIIKHSCPKDDGGCGWNGFLPVAPGKASRPPFRKKL